MDFDIEMDLWHANRQRLRECRADPIFWKYLSEIALCLREHGYHYITDYVHGGNTVQITAINICRRTRYGKLMTSIRNTDYLFPDTPAWISLGGCDQCQYKYKLCVGRDGRVHLSDYIYGMNIQREAQHRLKNGELVTDLGPFLHGTAIGSELTYQLPVDIFVTVVLR